MGNILEKYAYNIIKTITNEKRLCYDSNCFRTCFDYDDFDNYNMYVMYAWCGRLTYWSNSAMEIFYQDKKGQVIRIISESQMLVLEATIGQKKKYGLLCCFFRQWKKEIVIKN